MQIFNNLQNLPIFTNAVVTIGSFDGVHIGHQKILQQVVAEAKKIQGTSVLISFFPHPKQVIQMQNKTLQLLNTLDEKYALLEKFGIENVVIIPFDENFASIEAQDYIDEFLVKLFNPKLIVVGYDHKFGKNRTGDFALLKSNEVKYGFKVEEITEQEIEHITISSTKIRAALVQGDIETANTYLGYSFEFTGTVVEGNKVGRSIGYPTANIKIDNELKLTPANAVYAVQVKFKNNIYQGMLNIGNRPTVNGSSKTTEVNIFNFDEMIYGEKLTIILQKKLRTEVKFNGLLELQAQLAIDKTNSLQFFANYEALK
jgi:riboflavin kinase / FMN adenylyltransferase